MLPRKVKNVAVIMEFSALTYAKMRAPRAWRASNLYKLTSNFDKNVHFTATHGNIKNVEIPTKSQNLGVAVAVNSY